MNGFFLLIAALWQGPVSADNQTIGWRVGSDQKLELIVHVHPEDLSALVPTSPNPGEINAEIPEAVRGRFHRVIVRILNTIPERTPPENEIASYFPINQARIPQTLTQPGFADIDPTVNPLRSRDTVQASLVESEQGPLNPPSLQTPGGLRDRDTDFQTPMANNPNGNANRNTPLANIPSTMTDPNRNGMTPIDNGLNMGTGMNEPRSLNNNSMANGNIPQSGSNNNGYGTSFANPTPPSSLLANSNLYTGAPSSTNSLNNNMTGQRQPSFGTTPSPDPFPRGNNMASMAGGFQGNGGGGMNANSNMNYGNDANWMNNGGSDLTRIASRDLASDIERKQRSVLPSNTGLPETNSWYFPLFFLISFVVNVYCMIYLVKLRERYRALLAGARSGIDLGSSSH